MSFDSLRIKYLEKENWNDLLVLNVSDKQKTFIESTNKCIEDARSNAYDMIWHFYAIYNDNILIGFSMFGKEVLNGVEKIWLDRFMIDEKYQGNSFGKNSLKKIINNIFLYFNCDSIYLSVVKENVLAIKMYEKLGFIYTNLVDSNNEMIFTIKQ